MRRSLPIVAIAFVAMSVLSHPARADHQPVLVVPGKPGVPVIIHERDASWGVVEGDWGPYGRGHMPANVLYAPPVIIGPPGGGYYPHTGRRPRLGRFDAKL